MAKLNFSAIDKTVTETFSGLRASIPDAGHLHPVSFLIKGSDGGRLKIDCRYYSNRFSNWSFEVGVPSNEMDYKFPNWDIRTVRSERRSYAPVLLIDIPDGVEVTVELLPPIVYSSSIVFSTNGSQPNDSLAVTVAAMLNISALDIPDYPCRSILAQSFLDPATQEKQRLKEMQDWLQKIGYGTIIVDADIVERSGTSGMAIGCFVSTSNPYPVYSLVRVHGGKAFRIPEKLLPGFRLESVTYLYLLPPVVDKVPFMVM